jgi:predicted nucleic acid-binding protein
MIPLIVDANALYSYFSENSVCSGIIDTGKVRLFAPIFLLKEISKYEKYICNKFNFSVDRYKKIFLEICSQVDFIETNFFSDDFERFSDIQDIKDIDYITLSYKLNIPVWTNDKKFKEIKEIDSINTKELIELLS